MNDQVADQLQRNQALDTQHSYIVQAPAGSGKTELISQRFLALLAGCDKPESVLAITFTRKAASEMRIRILTALDAARLPPPKEEHKLKTWQLAKTVLETDAKYDWQLLNSPARLQIVTIDSLNASLTRQMPLLSKMGAHATPDDHPEQLYLEAARRTLKDVESDLWKDDLSTLLLHLGNNFKRIQQLLISMLAKRDQWLRHLTDIKTTNDDSRRHELERALYQLVKDQLKNLYQALPAGMFHELADLALFAAEHVAADKKPDIACWHQVDETVIKPSPDFLHYWQGLAELLFTDSDTPRKSVNKNIGFPAPSSEKDPERKQLLELKKQRLLTLIGEIESDKVLTDLFVNLRNMPALEYTDHQWQLVKALSRVMLLSAAHLQIVFSEQGQVDFTEIALSGLRSLGDEEQPTDLAMMLDYQLQHILVDEFQDTSQGQFELLEKLTRDWQDNDGKTLFLVGDPMQSIYRFREAEVGLYLKARKHGIGNVRLKPLYLQVNFRSQQTLVDWINHHLASAFAQQEDISTGAVTYNPSVPYHDALDSQAVMLHSYLERNDEQEAADIIDVISAELTARKSKKDDQSSIAILVRSRTHLISVIEALKNANIAFQAVDLDPLVDHPAIIDLYILTRALNHFADRLHWLALLRAPWCGLYLDDLLLIAEGPSPVIWQNCLDPEVTKHLSDNGQQRLNKLVSQVFPYIQHRGRLALKETLENLWSALGGHIIYPGKTTDKAVHSYLQLVDHQEQGSRIQDMNAFNEALASLFAPPDSLADGLLQIMTIHKSKGLEFDTVILPGLGKSGKHDDPGLLEWLERPNRDGEMDLLLAPIKASETDTDDSISKSLKAINKVKARHELTRLLYVALTRSKRKLHLFAHAQQDKKGNLKAASNSLLAILWPQLENEFNQSSAVSTIQESRDIEYQQCLKRLPVSWQHEPAEALPVTSITAEITDTTQSDIEFDWATETARYIGILTHRHLQQLADTDLSYVDKHFFADTRVTIENGLLNLGIQTDHLEQATGKVIMALSNMLQDKRGRWILKKHQDAKSEYDLTLFENNEFKRFIIDRTFVDEDDIRWIIDYKTGSHEGGDTDAFLDREKQRYAPQLEKYAQLLQKLDNRRIKLGLYFPMLSSWREWDYT